MANSGIFGLLLVTSFVVLCNLQIDAVYGQQQPRLEILPIQSVQRKPVGKSLMLTCRPNVPDTSLVTDLQWRDNFNMTVAPKPYYPKLDKMGNRINVAKFGQLAPPMYTEVLPGDQSLALLITSLTEGMAGKYYCSASYANTEQLEIDVRVETYVAITWKDAPENQFPTVGNRYTVKCEVTANPAPTVDWLRNGDPIKSGGRYVVEPRGLLIQNVDESDDGIYTCRAAVIQTGELVERNIRVEVQIVPHIGTIPKELEAVEEQPFSVQCMATGKPVPEYTWIKDSTQQNVQGADRFLVNPLTGQLSILRVTKDDYGSYTCVAKNSAGHDQKRTMLNVLVRPRIYELLNITVAEDHEAAIVCKATGRPAPEITFRRWGSTEELALGAQPADDRVVLEQRFDESLGESVGTLRIQKLMRTDDGLYECVARNRGEQAFRVGHITVEYKPSFEHMRNLPPVFSWDERRANLSCLAQGFPNATIEWRWNDRLIKDLGDANLLVEGSGPRSDLLVTPRGGQYYTAYKCIASNRLGRVEHMMELRQARVPSIIPQVRERVITATTITFDIISPATEPGLPIMAFTVMFKESIQPDWAYAYNRTWSPDSMYIVEGLRPQTMYEFQFAARNMVGLSQWGGKVSLHTPKRSAPEAPRILVSSLSKDDGDASGSQESDEAAAAGQAGQAAADRVYVSPYSDHIELSWSVPADNGEPINSYQVRYCPGHKRNGAWHELEHQCVSRDVLNSENSNFVMSKLEGDTYYRIELRAHNAIGFSQPSSLLMRTALGSDQVTRVESPILSSAAIVGIAIAVVLVLLLIVDLLCCALNNAGILATLCRRTKRSPSDLDEEAKIGSGQLVKEPPPSPAPLPPPVKLGSTPLNTPEDEREPLSNAEGSLLKNSRVEVDGRVVISKSGEIIGKNSSV